MQLFTFSRRRGEATAPLQIDWELLRQPLSRRLRWLRASHLAASLLRLGDVRPTPLQPPAKGGAR